MASFATRSSSKATTPRKREATPAPATPAEITLGYEEIAKRAFEKFAGRGFEHGFHDQDWFDAEDELRAEARERAMAEA